MNKTLYYNGHLLTMYPRQPRAEALVTKGERIVFVGEEAEARKLAGPQAAQVDLAGGALIPGFNDNHIHAVFTGLRGRGLDLTGLDLPQILEALKAYSPHPRRGELIEGANWDYPACPEPRKDDLDKIFPKNPVLLRQYGGHTVWANTRGLRFLGISPRGEDPPGGKILRDEKGEPTGVVREPKNIGMGLSRHPRRYFHWAWAYQQLLYSLDLFRQAGITTIQDNTWFPAHIQALKRLARRQELTARVSCWHWGSIPLLDGLMALQRFPGPLYYRGPVKYFIDGTFSSRTARLTRDYTDDPGNRGAGQDEQTLLKWLTGLARRKRQGAFHAIGDGAVKTFLDALEKLYQKYPQAQSLRFRLEHAQLIREEDIPRIKDLNVLICSQPHALITPEKDQKLLGKERLEQAYPYRRLLDAQAALSFGSDYPGEGTYAPLKGVALAVQRPAPLALTPYEALACYTRSGAYAEFQEDQKGMLKEGFLADMVHLERNPETCPQDQIEHIRVLKTILGGKRVFTL